LRLGQAPESLDATLAELHGLVSQMRLQGLADGRSIIRIEAAEILHGFARARMIS
jgi:hypothetical protein